MSIYVVDTNVLIAANGRNTHADDQCQLACVKQILEITARQIVAIDDKGLIISEYKRHLNRSGQPGIGDMFFKHLSNYEDNPESKKVSRHPITTSHDNDRKYDELPPNNLDRSDQKFLAVAVVAKASIVNATDSDWSEQAKLMESLGISVKQLCPQHASKEKIS